MLVSPFQGSFATNPDEISMSVSYNATPLFAGRAKLIFNSRPRWNPDISVWATWSHLLHLIIIFL